MPITPEGGRVLGSLVEKQLTTPQQYPLTANALTLACNQTTNREPVVAMDDDTVLGALDMLKQHEPRLVRFVLPSHGRSVVRYRHVLDEVFALEAPQLSLLALLLLRGAQTPGELRSRAGRMAEFASVEEVTGHLDRLAAQYPEPLVQLLPRRPGQKEDRWQQLLAGPWSDGMGTAVTGVPSEPRWDGPAPADDGATDVGSRAGPVLSEGSDMDRGLRSEIDGLRAEVLALQASVAELGASLEALRRSLGD